MPLYTITFEVEAEDEEEAIAQIRRGFEEPTQIDVEDEEEGE